MDRTNRIDFNILSDVHPFRVCKSSMRVSHFLVLAAIVLSMDGLAAAQQKLKAVGSDSNAAEISFTYKFENPRFDLKLYEIDLDANGVGELRFTRGESDDVLDCKVKLLPATIGRIRTLFEATEFLSSNTDYQDKKDFSHLGWVTLGAKGGGHERKAKFNYTTNPQIKELDDI